MPDLVEKRRVLMKGGMAYVPAAEQASIVFQEFQTHLEKALEVRPFICAPPIDVLTCATRQLPRLFPG